MVATVWKIQSAVQNFFTNDRIDAHLAHIGDTDIYSMDHKMTMIV